MKHKLLLFFSLLLFASSVTAQQYQKDEEDDPTRRPQKLGVRIGFGTYWLNAPEMRKGSAQLGVQGAIYYRMAFGKKLDINLELGACYRGSRFPFSETDTGFYYTRLGLFYMEMPLLAMVSLDKKKQHVLMFGPSVSYLLKPSLFIRNGYYPDFTQMPIKKWELSACLGYMMSFNYIGVYFGYKHGITNIAGDFANQDFPRDSGNALPQNLSEVSPALKDVKSIFNRTFEISLYF